MKVLIVDDSAIYRGGARRDLGKGVGWFSHRSDTFTVNG
jgi:hypothetical protein